MVVNKISDELVRSVIWKGDTTDTSGNKAIAICDGFKKLIAAAVTATEVTPIVTGTPTSSNAVSKFELVYQTAIASYEALSELPMIMYCSKLQKMNYKTDYRTRFTYDPSNYSDGKENLYLKLSEGQVEIKAVNWLNGSNKIIMTPQTNLKLGTNQMSDMNAINIIKQMWAYEAGIRFVVGLQIADTDVLFVNDAA